MSRNQRVMVQPINVIFKHLQAGNRVSVWLYDNLEHRIEGRIIGFDEFMNLVLDDAEEAWIKGTKTKSAGDRVPLVGALIGVLSIYLPKTPGEIASSSWANALHRYHNALPVFQNYAETERDIQEATQERLYRMMSKDAHKSIERLEERERKEFEKRGESPGKENQLSTELPAYWVLDPMTHKTTIWNTIRQEIEIIQPQNVILLLPGSDDTTKMRFSQSSIVPHLAASIAQKGTPTDFTPVPFSDRARILSKLINYPLSKIVQVYIPGDPHLENNLPAWISQLEREARKEARREEWIKIGEGIGEEWLRNKAVVIAFEDIDPLALHKNTRMQLHLALGHHTGHPRHDAFTKVVLIPSESKEDAVSGFEHQEKPSPFHKTRFAMVGVAGLHEGEEINPSRGDGSGRAWRFGHVPIK